MSEPIEWAVSEMVNVVTDQARGRTHWHLNSAQVGGRGEDAHVSLLLDGHSDGLIRIDVQVRGYWVAGRGRPSEPGALPLRWATDPPKGEGS